MAFTMEWIDRLIENVRNTPCLWNTEVKEYKLNYLKDRAWRELAKECGVPDVKEVKTMWRRLRDGHRQAIARRKPAAFTAEGAKYIWKYEKQMEFLLPTMRVKPRGIYYELERDNHESNEDRQQCEDSSESLQQQSADIILSKKTSLLNKEQENREDRSIERDALEKFFMSMLFTTSQLPERLQLRVQRQIFNNVMEAKEESMQSQSRTSVASRSANQSNSDLTGQLLGFHKQSTSSSLCNWGLSRPPPKPSGPSGRPRSSPIVKVYKRGQSDEEFETYPEIKITYPKDTDEGSEDSDALLIDVQGQRVKSEANEGSDKWDSGSEQEIWVQDEEADDAKRSQQATAEISVSGSVSTTSKPVKRGAPETTSEIASASKRGCYGNEVSSDEDPGEGNGDEGQVGGEEKRGKDSDDQADKSKQPPTDDEIKKYVIQLLKGANLNQITMKMLCKQVYSHYKDFDLKHKKDFIKTIVTSLISS